MSILSVSRRLLPIELRCSLALLGSPGRRPTSSPASLSLADRRVRSVKYEYDFGLFLAIFGTLLLPIFLTIHAKKPTDT